MNPKSKKQYSKLIADAKEVLKNNDRGRYIVPNPELYPHQWLWDSCFIAIGLANYDIKRAQVEILSLLSAQWQNGMVPSIVLKSKPLHGTTGKDKHGQIWRSWLNPSAPDDLQTSGITQPPMLAEAITRIGTKLTKQKRREWYKEVYPGLLKYHQWLYGERDPHSEGLVLLIHPWECGLDNSPPWMSELNDHLLPGWIRFLRYTHLDNIFEWFRSDNMLALKNQRLTNVEALALYSVQRRLRRKNYDFDRIIDHSLFAIEDLSFNSILIRANTLLEEIAEFIDEKLPNDLKERFLKAKVALNDLWDEYAQEYYSRDFVSYKLLKQSSIATFMPIYSGAIPKDKVQRIVESLENEHRFKTPYPVPSVPLDSNWFNPHRYWQGPTWINTNWLIIDGLRRYGFTRQADTLKERTIELVNKNGLNEYFDPIVGSALGINNFSWTAALSIDLILN